MNRLALSICILGVLVAGYAPVALFAEQDKPAPEAQGLSLRPAPLEADAATLPENPNAVTIAVWTPPAPSFAAPLEESVAAALPKAIYADALPLAYDGDYDDPVWAVVTRGARLHSGPSVSSSTLWFYPVGAQLHLIGYWQGWFKVVDPATSRRGYIYAAHYLDALRGPVGKPAVVAKAPVLPQTALTEPPPASPAKPAVKFTSRATPYLLAPPQTLVQPARAPSAAPSPDSVASLLDRAMRR